MSFNLYPVAADTITTQSITDMSVILDLDSTLLNTQESFDDFKKLSIMTNPNLLHIKKRCYCIRMKEAADNSAYNFWGIKRNHLDEFLLFCFNYFKYVIVWSAGNHSYVNSIVLDLFKNLRPPHFVWSKDDCVWEGKEKDITIKPLSKLINSDFGKKHNLRIDRMIHIDDNETTFSKNLRNAINIPPYDPEPTIEDLEQADTALLQIKYWLLLPHVMYSDDVTKLDMQNIFKHTVEDLKNLANMYN